MVKRYDPISKGEFTLVDDGPFVDYADYAALEAQVRHLEVYPGRCERLEIENAALRYRLSKLEREK